MFPRMLVECRCCKFDHRQFSGRRERNSGAFYSALGIPVGPTIDILLCDADVIRRELKYHLLVSRTLFLLITWNKDARATCFLRFPRRKVHNARRVESEERAIAARGCGSAKFGRSRSSPRLSAFDEASTVSANEGRRRRNDRGKDDGVLSLEG